MVAHTASLQLGSEAIPSQEDQTSDRDLRALPGRQLGVICGSTCLILFFYLCAIGLYHRSMTVNAVGDIYPASSHLAFVTGLWLLTNNKGLIYECYGSVQVNSDGQQVSCARFSHQAKVFPIPFQLRTMNWRCRGLKAARSAARVHTVPQLWPV